MKIIVAVVYFLFLITSAQGQQKTIDSLQNQLKTTAADTNRVQILGSLVKIYYLFKPDTALILAQEGYNLSLKLNYTRGEALSLNRIAMCYSAVGDYPKALQYLTKSLSLYENINDQEGMLRSINNIGDTYMTRGDYAKALEYFFRAKKTADVINWNYGAAIISLNIGQCYANLKKPDSSLVYLQQYYPFAKRNGFEDLYGDFERTLGDVEVMKGHSEKALEYFNNSIASSKNIEDQQCLSSAFQSISTLYQTSNQKDSAILYAKRSLDAAELGSYNLGVLKASNLLSRYYEGKDDKEAFRYFKIATQAKDSIFSQEKVKQMLSLSFEERQRQQDIETEKRNYSNRIKLYVLAGILIMFLLIAIILLRNNRQKQKANLLLQSQKQEIQKTLSELKATQDQLIQSEKMASLGELTAGIAHEIQNPLNFVNNFSEVSREMLDEMKAELATGNNHQASNIATDIQQNLEKIIHHGKRADGIVKGMLQHSRVSTGSKEAANINALAEEYLRLSYHGFRAKDKAFNANIQTSFDHEIEKVHIIPQDIGRVFLNLYNNAFYALAEKSKQGIPGYEPTVIVATKKQGNKVIISVRDNGNGIPQKLTDKIFQPFFTTKPTGQGTGLGLSLSYDIIKAHGGEIKLEAIESQGKEPDLQGEGTGFIIRLPVSP